MKKEENETARIAELEAALENVKSILNRIGVRAILRKFECECESDATNFWLIQEDAVKAVEICKNAVRAL